MLLHSQFHPLPLLTWLLLPQSPRIKVIVFLHFYGQQDECCGFAVFANQIPHPTQTWCYMPGTRQPGNHQNMTTCLAAAPSNSCYCNSCSQHQERFHHTVQLSTFCTALRWRLSPTHAQQGKSFVVLFLSQQVGLLYPELPSSRQLLPAIK